MESVVAKSVDIGGHYLGNFPKYYEFNPPQERLGLLDIGKVCDGLDGQQAEQVTYLDVGCNDGSLTMGLHEALAAQVKSIKTLGVDVDQGLIDRAREQYEAKKDSCAFQVADFVTERDLFAQQRFDLVSCFGLLMWVHLNKGDQGLKDLLELTCTCATKSVILEIHTWKNYKNAKKRLRKSKIPVPDSFVNIQITGDDKIREFVDSIMMQHFEHKIEFGETNWERPIILYFGKVQRPNQVPIVGETP